MSAGEINKEIDENINEKDEQVERDFVKGELDDKKSLLNLETEYHIYSYITADNDPGTVIVDSKLSKLFEDQVLFGMDNCSKIQTFKISDLLKRGFICAGSVDLMETLDIVYPNKKLFPNSKPKIVGKYMHGSRKRLIGEKLDIDFDYEPESDHEYVDFDDQPTNQSTDDGLKWIDPIFVDTNKNDRKYEE